jgi:DNA-binding MarR family transcriptional regulator
MGIFSRIQKEIDDRDKQEGITPADLLDLSPSLRRLMNRITRQGEITTGTAAEYLEETPDNAQQMLNALVEKGYLERVEKEDGWVYRTRFARKRGHELPAGIWSALGQRTREE